MDGPIILNVFSPPRCLSTALMYSFAQHKCCRLTGGGGVYDEPLYYSHLSRNPHLGATRPYLEQLSKEQSADTEKVLSDILQGQDTTSIAGGSPPPVRYVKHIAKQFMKPEMVKGGAEYLLHERSRNVLLIRNPLHQLTSWAKGFTDETLLPSSDAQVKLTSSGPAALAVKELRKEGAGHVECTMDEVGWADMLLLYSFLVESGKPPVVIDCEGILQNPAVALSALCGAVGLPFDAALLQWEAGPKPYDGCWAPYWYASIHRSTCFMPPAFPHPLHPNLYPLLELCTPVYQALMRHVLATSYSSDQVAAKRDGAQHTPLHLPASSTTSLTQSLPKSQHIAHPDKEKPNQSSTSAETIQDHGLTRSLVPEPRNSRLLVWIGDRLVPRALAGLSPFDSTVQG